MSSQTNSHLALGINIQADGAHPAAWQTEGYDPYAPLTLDYWIEIAQTAEAGKLDFMFFGDSPAMPPVEFGPFGPFDPLILLTAIAAHTEHIGLAPTITTSFEEPFNVARRLASLDHLSGGRAAWNIVTTLDVRAAANFTADPHMDKAERYARADEFVEVATELWDSWDDDAVVGDKETPIWTDPARVHAIDHHGGHFDVAGPLNVNRSPQGWPVLVQAGSSPAGLELGAKWGEVIFTSQADLEAAVRFREGVRQRVVKYGRRPDDVRILPGLDLTIGSTEAEAKQRRKDLNDLGEVRLLGAFAAQLGVFPDELDLDKRLPRSLLDGSQGTPGSQGGRDYILNYARKNDVTVRELVTQLGTFHRLIVGAPEQIADSMEEWFRAGAVDGFVLMPDVGPSGLRLINDELLPVLRDRGLFRSEYEGTTLRDNLGLARRPTSRALSSAA